MTTDRTEKPMPDSLMRAIQVTIEDKRVSVEQRLEAALLIATGYGLFERAESIDPTAFAIPEPQWTQISQWLVDVGRTTTDDPIRAVNLSLSWMNSGPGAYPAEEVKEG